MSDPSKKPHMQGGNWKDRISLDPEEKLENEIYNATRVRCGITMEPERILIASCSEREYYLARAEVKKRSILEIERK